MKRIETPILFNCSLFGLLMTNPVGKTNAQKYIDAVEAVAKAVAAKQEAAAKWQAATDLADELEKDKDNEVPTRKNSKSPAQKYIDARQSEETAAMKDEAAYDKLVKAIEAKEQAEKVKDVPVLSATAKKVLKTIAIAIRYNRKKRIENRYTKKGSAVEDESILLYSEYKGEAFENNKKRSVNDYFTGEWDIEIKNRKGKIVKVDDIKSRFDIDTFEDHRDEDVKATERYQLLGYCDILDSERAAIANVLTNNDFQLIWDEIHREVFSTAPSKLTATGDLNLARALEIAKDNIFDLMTYNDFLNTYYPEDVRLLSKGLHPDEEAQAMYDGFIEVPLDERVIETEIEVDSEEIERMHKRAIECREWLAINYNIHHVAL